MAQQESLSYDRAHSNSRRKRIRITKDQGEIVRKLLQLAVTNHEIRKMIGADYDITKRALISVGRDLGKPDKKNVPAKGSRNSDARRG